VVLSMQLLKRSCGPKELERCGAVGSAAGRVAGIFDYVADPELAQRYEDAMRRRCAGLRITNEPTTTASKAGS